MVDLWDLALDSAQFLAVAEHRFIPSSVRLVSHQLCKAGHQSVWSPVCQDQVAGGHAGEGVVCLGGAPLFLSPPSLLLSLRSFSGWAGTPGNQVLNCVGVVGRVESVMCFMEGQGVDGHVGDESSPYRNTFVSVFEYVSLSPLSFSSPLSCLVLSCLVLSCLVVSCRVVSCRVVSCRVGCGVWGVGCGVWGVGCGGVVVWWCGGVVVWWCGGVVWCCVVLCGVVLCCVLCCVVCCVVLCCVVLCCVVLCCVVLCVLACVLACSTLSAVSLRRAGVQQLHQVILKLDNAKETRVSFGEPLGRVITLRGPFRASRQIGDKR